MYLMLPDEIHSDFFSLMGIESHYEHVMRLLIKDVQKVL
jgi:hypothetical protein